MSPPCGLAYRLKHLNDTCNSFATIFALLRPNTRIMQNAMGPDIIMHESLANQRQ